MFLKLWTLIKIHLNSTRSDDSRKQVGGMSRAEQGKHGGKQGRKRARKTNR